VTRATATTKAAVGKAVVDGMASGETMNEIASRIEALPEMRPARALTVARTESNRAANAGAVAAAEQADAELGGDAVEVEWLSARDEVVRDAHRSLDGKRVKVGAEFRIGSATAKHPGGFGVAELDINCRCTTVPVLSED
jgi:SPP1 gp7 family putative phage head morphogenesis protein